MTNRLLIVAAIGLVGIFGSRAMLEGTEDFKHLESATPVIGELGSGPQTVAVISSMTLGGLKSVGVNILWMRWSALREEKRYFESLALARIIQAMQRNNEEVPVFIAWEMAYNISLGEREIERQFMWIDRALTILDEAERIHPDSIYIRFYRGEILSHRIPQSEELLALYEKEYGESSFTRAINTYKTCLEMFTAQEREYVLSPIGLYVYPQTLHAKLRDVHAMEGWWRLMHHNDLEGAQVALAEATAEATYIYELKTYSIELNRKLAQWYPALGTLLEEWRIFAEDPGRWNEEARAILWIKATKLLSQSPDTQFANEFLPAYQASLNEVLGGDPYEFNDTMQAAMEIYPGQRYVGWIGPHGDDEDFFMPHLPGSGDWNLVVHGAERRGLKASWFSLRTGVIPGSVKALDGSDPVDLLVPQLEDDFVFLQLVTPEGVTAQYELELVPAGE